MTFGPEVGLTVDITPHGAVLVHPTYQPPLPSVWDEAVLWAHARGYEPADDLPDIEIHGVTIYLLRRLSN
jgi:hypothetical protein